MFGCTTKDDAPLSADRVGESGPDALEPSGYEQSVNMNQSIVPPAGVWIGDKKTCRLRRRRTGGLVSSC
jgi:hypothetical protein